MCHFYFVIWKSSTDFGQCGCESGNSNWKVSVFNYLYKRFSDKDNRGFLWWGGWRSCIKKLISVNQEKLTNETHWPSLWKILWGICDMATEVDNHITGISHLLWMWLSSWWSKSISKAEKVISCTYYFHYFHLYCLQSSVGFISVWKLYFANERRKISWWSLLRSVTC